MTKEGDIPTIFNPRRGRAPSVLVTDEGVSANGPFAHADSVSSSQQETVEQLSSPAAQTATTTIGFRGRLKSCSSSLCSQSARKVRKCMFILLPLGNVNKKHNDFYLKVICCVILEMQDLIL